MFKRDVSFEISSFSDVLMIKRDCSFHSIAKIPTVLDRRLVPVTKAKYLGELLSNLDGVAGVITTEECADKIPEWLGCAISTHPLAAAYEIHKRICADGAYWAAFPSSIHETARVHPRAYVAPENVVIGAGTVVDANASIMENTIIGDSCYVGAGTVIGSRAYEVGPVDGRQQLLPQAGGVLIGNNVTFLSNVTVAKSIFPLFTEISDGCSFDNLVHVAHDCRLGSNVKMMAGAVLCGRVHLSDGASIAPNATVANGVVVGEKAVVSLGSVVVRHVHDGETVTGNFAMTHREFLRRSAKR